MEGFCRGCLTCYDDITELLQYSEKIERLFMYSTGILLRSNDRNMFKLCKGCFLNMKQCCKFKKQCKISEKKFKHYLSLKEIGDTYDLATYLRNNEDSIRFPSLSGNSTPANQKVKDDDNESTCTSIRNFMTDLLQGEEVPDAEEHIIREVIEEETSALDDTLDSFYLHDDGSVGNISRLDLSFSPFSMSNSVCNDNFNTSLKQNESELQDADSYPKLTSRNFKDIQNESNNQGNKGVIPSNTELDEAVISIKSTVTKPQNLVDDQDIKYPPENENDKGVKNILESNTVDNSIHNESYYAVKALLNDNSFQESTEQFIAKIEIRNEENLNNNNLHNQSNSKVSEKSCDIVNEKIGYENNESEQSSTNQKGLNAEKLKNCIYINMENGNEITINGNQIIESWNKKDANLSSTDKNCKDNDNLCNELNNTKSECNNDILKDFIESDVSQQPNNKYSIIIEPMKINEENNDQDSFEKALKVVENDKISLSDLLVSPAGYAPAPGASTPMINNILFGENLDLDNTASKCSDELNKGVDILDEILNEGIKEFDINTQDGTSDVMYDLLKFMCKTCNRAFKNVTTLKRHLARVHDVRLPHIRNREFDKKTRNCPICAKVYRHYSAYRMHMQKHETVENRCSFCKLSFSSEKKLEQHKKTHNALQSVGVNEKIKNFICTVCGAAFSTPGNFSVHMRRHSRQYTHRCEECSKGFYRKSDYDDHMRVHTGERPFPCEHCDKTFRRRYELVKHIKLHLDDKNFECDYCSKKCFLKSDLVLHIKRSRTCLRLRAGLKPLPPRRRDAKSYECGYCHQVFQNQRKFVSHQKNFLPCRTLHANPVVPQLSTPLVESDESFQLVNDEDDEEEDVDIMED